MDVESLCFAGHSFGSAFKNAVDLFSYILNASVENKCLEIYSREHWMHSKKIKYSIEFLSDVKLYLCSRTRDRSIKEMSVEIFSIVVLNQELCGWQQVLMNY